MTLSHHYSHVTIPSKEKGDGAFVLVSGNPSSGLRQAQWEMGCLIYHVTPQTRQSKAYFRARSQVTRTSSFFFLCWGHFFPFFFLALYLQTSSNQIKSDNLVHQIIICVLVSNLVFKAWLQNRKPDSQKLVCFVCWVEYPFKKVVITNFHELNKCSRRNHKFYDQHRSHELLTDCHSMGE